MADIRAEPKRFDTFFAEELYFVIPIGNATGPISCCTFASLFVNVQILTDKKSLYFPTFAAIVRENALIGMGLCHTSQFIVPFHLLHVRRGGLGPWSSAFFEAVGDLGSKLVVNTQNLTHLRSRHAAAQHLTALITVPLILAHSVFSGDATVVKVNRRHFIVVNRHQGAHFD